MSLGTPGQPLRIAIFGSGPSAFYAALHLLGRETPAVEIDMFDRLPTPFGLVRAGVAPDHQKIKTVTRGFSAVATDPRFRFFGGVEYGTDLHLEDIRRHYHQVLFATGAQSDRKMGIPGEDLERSHPATHFVAWYNGHPDFRDAHFDLTQESVVVVGVGNVAVDVARILSLTPHELKQTDMPEYAIKALSESRVREVHLLGRRGPAQAAFTTPELKELGEMEGSDLVILQEEAALDPLSAEDLAKSGDKLLTRKVELIASLAGRPAPHPKNLNLRFFVAPTEVLAGEDGGVGGVRVAKNRLVRNEMGTLITEATGEEELIPAGLVFRSVGYRGAPLPGIPFNERTGTILNSRGRVLDSSTQKPLPGLYCAGWIKRGPSGVIGTNKPCSVETTEGMLEDAAASAHIEPADASREGIENVLHGRGVDWVTFEEWQRLDALEVAAGLACGRPRVKFTSREEMASALAAGG